MFSVIELVKVNDISKLNEFVQLLKGIVSYISKCTITLLYSVELVLLCFIIWFSACFRISSVYYVNGLSSAYSTISSFSFKHKWGFIKLWLQGRDFLINLYVINGIFCFLMICESSLEGSVSLLGNSSLKDVLWLNKCAMKDSLTIPKYFLPIICLVNRAGSLLNYLSHLAVFI